MKQLLWNILLGVTILVLPHCLQGQLSTPEKPWGGRTYVVQQYGVQNHYFARQADIAIRQFDFEGAFFALENAVASNPNSAEMLMRRAAFRRTFGMEHDASTDIRLVNRMNPYLADLHGYNGPEGQLRLLDEKTVDKLFKTDTLSILDDYYRLWDSRYSNHRIEKDEMNGLDQTMRLIEKYNFENALQLLDQILQAFPESGLAYDLKGMIYARLGKLELANEALSAAVALVPNFSIAWYNYARVQELQGNLDQATIYYERALQLQEDLVMAQMDKARLHQVQGSYQEALKSFSEIAKSDGENQVEAFLQRGMAKRQLGDFGGALVDYNRAIAAYPDNADLLQNRGNLNLVFGFYHHAIQDYKEALDISPELASSLYNRGLAHFLVYDPVSACFDLQRSADLGHERAALKYTYFCGE
mgnify:CR=1 FL=1